MQQMTGLDHMFLGLDTATSNGVLGGLVKFAEPRSGQPVPDATFLVQRLTERLPLIPPMSKRIVNVPLALDHSYLATCDRVDVAARVRTLRVPAPGTDRELAAEVSRIMSTPMVADGPLWDLTVLEGLAGGGVAHLLRIHHAVVDGSTMPTIWDLLSDEPAATMPDAPPVRTLPEPLLGSAEMAARAAYGTLARPVRGARLALQTLSWGARRLPSEGWTTWPGLAGRFLPGAPGRLVRGAVNRRRRATGQPEVTAYLPGFYAPPTPFNGRQSARRHFVIAEMDLARVKAVGKAAGTTLNNVVVTLCTGALREHLIALGHRPTEPIVVCVPVSLRHPDIEEPWSNHVHMMFAELPVHLADPMARLAVVTENLTTAKASFDSMPIELFRDASRFLPRDLFGWLTQAWIRLPDKYSRGPWNVVVSNVRGPTTPATMNGLRVQGYWPASFLSIGGGINITLQSYVDRICFGLIGSPELVGDLWPLIDRMHAALDELERAAQGPGDSVVQLPAGATRRRSAEPTPTTRRARRSAP